jgi:hypothetical protein
MSMPFNRLPSAMKNAEIYAKRGICRSKKILINSELDALDTMDSADDYIVMASKYDGLVNVVRSMQRLGLIDLSVASSLTELLEERSFEYSERAREIAGPEPDYDDETLRSIGEESIDLNEFFKDL